MRTSVAGALLYLRLTSWRNALRARLLRLRQPKYLAGGIIGIAYLYFFFVRPVSSPRGQFAAGPEFLSMLELGGAAVVLVFAVLSWILPSAPTGLAFTEVEIATLFPAPIRRRTLVHYRLLSSQFALLFSALIFGLVSARWNVTGNFLMRTIAWWFLLVTLNLHGTGAALAIGRLLDIGITAWPRRALFLVIVSAGIVAGFMLAPDTLAIEQLGLRGYLDAVSRSGPIHWMLAVPKLVTAPFLARDVATFLVALGPALLVVLAHYVWVLYTATDFEEASLASAQRRAARLAAFRAGKSLRTAGAPAKRQAEPFKLTGRGRTESAFLWKNLLAGSAFFRPRRLALVAVALFVGCRWLTGNPDLEPFARVVFTLSFIVMIVTALLGPHMARNDLRSDLPNADLLKTYPLPGWQIAFGELLAPVFALTSVLWLALLAAAMTVPDNRLGIIPIESRATVAVAVAFLVPAWCAIQIIVLNCLTLLFPAWLQLSSDRGDRGFDVLGQRILFMAAQLLVVLIAFIPASLVATIVVFALRAIAGDVVAAVGAIIAIFAVLAAEIAGGILLLGRIFDRFDLSTELRT